MTVGLAGKSAWLTGILAFPALLLLAWMLHTLVRAGGGLADALQKAFGTLLGKAAILLYVLWALFVLSMAGRLYAERMLSTGYQNTSLAGLLLVLLALVLWIGRRKLEALARTAEICYLVLVLTLGAVLLFCVVDLAPAHVLPVWFSDLPQVAAATRVPVGILSYGVFAAFLTGRVTRRPEDKRRGILWLAAGCAVVTVLQFGVVGQLGDGLCVRVDVPFFEVARAVGLDGAFQRMESIVVAVWILSDFVLLAMLVFAVREMAKALFGEKAERWAPFLAVILAFLGGQFLFKDDFSARSAVETIVPIGNLTLAYLIPAIALLCLWVKGRKEKREKKNEKNAKRC